VTLRRVVNATREPSPLIVASSGTSEAREERRVSWRVTPLRPS
jgi:hypothetical protein